MEEIHDCDDEVAFETDYLLYMCASGILIVLHLSLFTHTLYSELAHRGDPKFTKSWGMRALYITVQIMAGFWVISDFIVHSFNPHEFIIKHPFLCRFVPYCVYGLPPVFYGLYLLQIQFRYFVTLFLRSTLIPSGYMSIITIQTRNELQSALQCSFAIT